MPVISKTLIFRFVSDGLGLTWTWIVTTAVSLDYGWFVGGLFMFITHLISTLPGKIPAVLLDKLPYNCGFIHLTWSEHEAGG